MRKLLRWLFAPPPTPAPEPKAEEPVRECTVRPCGYCGREPPYSCWNDGVCESCARSITTAMRGGVRLPWPATAEESP